MRMILAALAALMLMARLDGAAAADINILRAEVTAGRLLITGFTRSPNTRIRLDGQTDAAFNVRSNGRRIFTFSLVYLPATCIVTLQTLKPPSTLGTPTKAVVGNCAPAGSPGWPSARIVRKTCDDAGGWTAVAPLAVYCTAACDADETAIYGLEELGVLRDGSKAKSAPTYVFFQSTAVDPALPVGRWYFYWANAALNAANPLKAKDFSSMTVAVACQPS